MKLRALVVLLLVTSTAAADKKTQGMTPGFQREAAACTTQISGLRKVQTGATALAPTLSPEDRAALDKDLEALATGLAGVETYCAAVTELVAFLAASKDASYKSVEKELDTRDNTVRKLRKESKKIIEAMTPITRRWIGRIAQNQVRRPDVPKPKPTAFPSGHRAALPHLGKGTWSVSGGKNHDVATYAERGGETVVTVDWQDGDQCQPAKSRFTLTPIDGGLTAPDGVEIVWHARVERKTYSEAICMLTNGRTAVAAISQDPEAKDRLAVLRQLGVDLVRSQATAKTP